MQRVLTQRERVILYATGALLAFALALNTVCAPWLRKAETLNREIALTRAKIQKYANLLARRDAIRKRSAAMAAQVNVSGAQTDPMVAALSELENIARQANVKITDVRPQQAGASSGYRQTVVDIRAEGDMEGFVKFSYDLDNSLALLRIRRFHLGAKSGTALLEGTFSLEPISVR